MALFEKTDPDVQAQKAAEAALRAKRRDRDNLAERLGIAEAAITSYRAQARQLAADGGDDKAISAAEGKMRDSQDRVQTLTGALADVDKTIAGLERDIDQIVDKRCRAETSIAVTAMADRIAKAQAAHQAAAIELEAASKEGGILIPESRAVYEFTLSARTQLVPAVEMVIAGLKAHARGVLSGHGPASLPRPAAPAPVLTVVPAAEKMQTIFIKRNLKYLDQAGRIVTIAGNRKHSLPQKLAELALSTKLALPLSDQQRIRELEYNAPPFHVPDRAACEWLGEKGAETPVRSARHGGPPIHSSLTKFEPHPGYVNTKPFTVTVPRGPEPEPIAATGTRAMPEDGES
jgi:hypothetical protein